MKENQLKKEFKTRDVERARNIIKKDYTSKTVAGTGYKKQREKHSEGDIWEEDGKTWTIKNGIKQTITKLDAAKKAAQVPLKCPKCSGPMNYHLSKKMYKIHKMCFDCVIDMEAGLRRAGLYDAYEKAMVTGGIRAFAKDIEQWVLEAYESSNYVTEDGDVEEWNSNDQAKQRALANVKEFIDHVNESLGE
jgi:Lhr-like helicase